MKIKSSVFLAAIFATLSLSAQNFTYNFDGTDNDAWVDGDGLNSGGGILAQASWVIDELDGDLHAFTNGNYQKAIFFTPASEDAFAIGDTVTLDTSLRLATKDWGTTGDLIGEKALLRIGLRGDYTNATTDVGVEIFAHNLFKFKINDADGSTRLPFSPTNSDLDFHDVSVAITKSETLNTFDVSATWDGGDATNYTIVNPSLYSVDRVFAVLGGRQNNAANTGGIWIDSFSASTSAVPEASTYASIFGLMALAFVVSRRKRD
tara:strand:+ start:126 stop:914 length:789 start_codon:yes stop_codon:yes gene_type:complete